MSSNLITIIQEELGYPPLQKIDPNTQEVIVDTTITAEHKFSQAAIPSVLLSLYKYTTTAEGATTIIENKETPDWLSIVFNTDQDVFVEKISVYAHQPPGIVITKLNQIYSAAIAAIHTQITSTEVVEVQKLLEAQRMHILPYLPPQLQMGSLLNDSSLDDRTNKMEGPVSNLLHALGNVFSSSEEAPNVKS